MKRHDKQGRRMRWDWPREIESLIYTEWDYQVLRELMRYYALRIDLLQRLLPERSNQTARKRIAHLWAARNLMRPTSQKFAENANYQSMYYRIAPIGQAAFLDHFDRPHPVSLMDTVKANFAHDVAGVCNSEASIEAGARAAGMVFVTWPEIMERYNITRPDPLKLTSLVKRSEVKFRPDGFFGIRDGDTVSFFMHEHERENGGDVENLGRASWRKKLYAYEHYMKNGLYKTDLGIGNMRVLVTTTTKKKAKNLAEYTERTIGPSNRYLFTHVPDLGHVRDEGPYPDLFAVEWLRPGKEPTRLMENKNTP